MHYFQIYFKDLQGHRLEDITEHSHRKSLQNLLESIAESQKCKIKILHEPKREGKFGSPDFKVTSTESIVGYVENKKIEENLDKTLKTDQIKKYKELSNNILLTNYIDWVWLKDGEVIDRQTLCYKTDLENKKTKLDLNNAEKVNKLITNFFSQAPKQISNAKILAEALAIRAKRLKEFLFEELSRQKDEDTSGRLYQLFETFKQFIFHELSIEEFSDAFAQNLVYGLFLAKLNADAKTVDVYNAKKFIPNSFELIRELVNFLDELDNEEYKETKWIVEEVLTILNNLNLKEINRTLHFSKSKSTNLFGENEYFYKDPFVYFYEYFLSVYDKKLRKAKGVYYTPPPVVNFIVRAVNDILKDTFKIKEGLANKERVTVLDFATGTGTFLLEVFQQIFDSLPKGSAKKDGLIKDHILKNIYGFEYLIAPYTIAHLKLSQFLKDQGYTLQPKERLQVFLTNTLEPIDKQIKIPLLPALTEESKHAQEVKDKPILVITGNPPYSYKSKNNGDWIKNKIENYRYVDGVRFKEKNPKGLQDDYVKFIRFAQDKMDQAEEGIVSIITNHSFIDNPTFRGMRQSLMKTFNHIYVIDLHGNLKKKEKTPSGTKDENVFDIEQGTAITIFIKKKGLSPKVNLFNLYGKRNEKYLFCSEKSVNNLSFENIKPKSPFYLFNECSSIDNSYSEFISLNEIFEYNSVGIVTSRDNFVLGFTKNEVSSRIKSFLSDTSHEDELKKQFFKENDKIDIAKVRSALKKENVESQIIPCNYRQFDVRWIFYNKILIDRSRSKIMNNFIDKENLGLLFRRQYKHGDFTYVNVVDKITEARYMENAYSHVYVNPLYIFNSTEEKTENFKKIFREFIDSLFNYHFSPEEIFAYIFAILNSPTYRAKYSEELKGDFPKIPITKNKTQFIKLAKVGQKLITAQLLKDTSLLNDSFGQYLGSKNHTVETPKFLIEKGVGKLYINPTNYFNNVPEEIYLFFLGGYQVLEKYLKDRKGMVLTPTEQEHIEHIVQSIAFTIDTMKEIDKLTKDWI